MPDLVAAVAEPNRRRLLQLLGPGEQTVSQLASHFTVSRSAISQHLGVLADSGLVTSRRAGKFQYYRLNARGMAALRAELDSFWTRELDQLVRDARAAALKETSMPFEKSVLVPLNADETFALITQPDRLRRWQVITARVDLRAGGEYRWTVIPGNSAAGTFTEVEPGRRVVFTWGWEGSAELPPGASTVIITLEPAAGGTMVHLTHEGLSGEQEASHAAGWTHYLGRLVTAATAGDAGPDEWAAKPDLDPLSSAEATLAICQRILRGVAEDDYHKATVCTEFDVTQLADHLIGSVTYLCAGGGRRARCRSGYQSAGDAGRHGGPGHARGLARPRARRQVKVGPHEMPAGAALGILSIEFLVHAWDFAQATGQQVAVSDEVAQHVLGLARQIITPEARGGGSFADPIEAGPDAGLLDRLIAFTGRTTTQ